MSRRKACVVEGFSLSEANEQAHCAVDEVVEQRRLFNLNLGTVTYPVVKLQ